MVRELGADESALAWEAIRELRPHLDSATAFAARVEEMRAGGFRLVGSFEAGEEDAAAVAGFRISESLAWGRFLYLDDLVTRSALRGRGHAGALMHWLREQAVAQGCGQLHLDSGVGAERHAAHRFYFGEGLVITAHHFAAAIAASSSSMDGLSDGSSL